MTHQNFLLPRNIWIISLIVYLTLLRFVQRSPFLKLLNRMTWLDKIWNKSMWHNVTKFVQYLFRTIEASGHSLLILLSKAELQLVLNRPNDLRLRPWNHINSTIKMKNCIKMKNLNYYLTVNSFLQSCKQRSHYLIALGHTWNIFKLNFKENWIGILNRGGIGFSWMERRKTRIKCQPR